MKEVDESVIVLVSRFKHNGKAHMEGLKLSDRMDADLEIDLLLDCGSSRKLILRGIVEHRGASLTSDTNHYVAYVHNGESWYLIDGACSERVEFSRVQEAQVYLALYERVE